MTLTELEDLVKNTSAQQVLEQLRIIAGEQDCTIEQTLSVFQRFPKGVMEFRNALASGGYWLEELKRETAPALSD